MPSRAGDRPTGLPLLWIVLRYLSALAAALPFGAAVAMVFCVAQTGGIDAFGQWAWRGPQHDPTFPGPAWALALVLLGCGGLAPALWAAWRLRDPARLHGRIAVAVGLLLVLPAAGLLVCLAVVVAAWLTTAIALP